MSDDRHRVCAHCGSGIVAEPQVLFCDEHCTHQYLHDHDGVPEEPVTA